MLHRGHPRARTRVDRGRSTPLPQRLSADTELGRDLTDRFELGLIIGQSLLEQPQRALPKLRRVLTGHDPSSNKKRNQTQGNSLSSASTELPRLLQTFVEL